MSTRRVTSQDVAELAGVSRTTVSLVLNDVQDIKISPATRQRVFQAVQDLGYVPDAAAQALASRRAQIIGLILTRRSHQIASDAFIPQILEGLLDVMHQYDMRLIVDIVEPEHQSQAYLQLVRSKRIDGILLSGPRSDDDALRTLEQDGFPTVLIGQLPGTGFCSVDIDNRAAARMAVAHLVNLGHRRIACITNAPIYYTAAADRLSGYQQALEAAGLPYDPGLVRYADFTMESGYERMRDLLDEGLPFTAAFVASDTVALGAKAAMLERGLRIPADIALVGFDDLPIAKYIDPPLTTVHLPVAELARQASEMLIRIREGEGQACENIILDAQLVIRKSCGASSHG
ncbi:MAG: LacI family DNA-binding transcriptional regulator [Anaerolineales bacterium]|nr:LacI family DNA-binding transcriptional regulator [Anaerolineales bacterium]